jgi:hypothetical protein
MTNQLVPILPLSEGYGDEAALKCPSCGFEYTHLETIDPIDGYDGRLDALLTFTCEKFHRFGIRVRQHKGWTTLAVEYVVGLRTEPS